MGARTKSSNARTPSMDVGHQPALGQRRPAAARERVINVEDVLSSGDSFRPGSAMPTAFRQT